MHDGVDRGAESHGRRDHFVARPNAQRHQSEMYGSRSAAYRGCVGRAFIAGELLLQLFDSGPQADPAAA
jgi:hypothetical protein